MKNKTTKRDWRELAANDMKEIILDLSDEEISQFSKQDFKLLKKNRNIVFSELETQKSDNSKVRNTETQTWKLHKNTLLMASSPTKCLASF